MPTQTLEAGRELDALIAETVFGLRVMARDWPCGYLPPCYELVASDTAEPTIDLLNERHPVYRDAEGELQPVLAYSTDIADGWDVVERLRAWGWVMSLSVNEFITEPWDCRWFHGEDKRAIGHGATASVAICRAALAALKAV